MDKTFADFYILIFLKPFAEERYVHAVIFCAVKIPN